MKKIFANKNLITVLMAVFVGLLLVLFGLFDDSDKDIDEIRSDVSYSSTELESYTTSLEDRVANHIEKIGGVSYVSVLLTIDASSEKVYATEGASKDYVIIKDSGGNENALVLSEINAQIRGIAVVCDYGRSEEMRQKIITMLSSLFNIGTNRISVMSA